MIKGKSNSNLQKLKGGSVQNIEKIRQKQLQNIEYLKNLEDNIKKHSLAVKGNGTKSSKFYVNNNQSSDMLMASKNADESNNNISTKISSLTNNVLSENRLKNNKKQEKKSYKPSGTSLKQYLNFKLSKIESQGQEEEDEIEQLKKCLVSYVDLSSKKRNKSEVANQSFTDFRTPNFKNRSFSTGKKKKSECVDEMEMNRTSLNLGENHLMRKNGSCQFKAKPRNLKFKNDLNNSVNRKDSHFGNISENLLFTENDTKGHTTINNKSNISEDYSNQYDKVTKQKIVILKRILHELLEKSQVYPFLFCEIESIFKENFGLSTNQSFINLTNNNAKSFIFENQSEENLLKSNSKFVPEDDLRRENAELRQNLQLLEKKIKIYEKENEDLRIHFSTNYVEIKKDENTNERLIKDKYKNKTKKKIEELETLSNNSDEEVKSCDDFFKKNIKASLQLREQYKTELLNKKSIKELDDQFMAQTGMFSPEDQEQHKTLMSQMNDGNLLSENMSLDNLENEIKKVEYGNCRLKVEMKLSGEGNEFNSNATVKYKNNIGKDSQN